MRKAVLGEEIQLFGDGTPGRDFDYVDDVVDAFLRAGAADAADGQVFNLGGERAGVAARPREAAGRDRRAAARTRCVPFPPERKRIDIGDFYADADEDHGRRWAGSRRSPLRDGLDAHARATTGQHKEHYL